MVLASLESVYRKFWAISGELNLAQQALGGLKVPGRLGSACRMGWISIMLGSDIRRCNLNFSMAWSRVDGLS